MSPYTPTAPTSRIQVGPHNIPTRNGIVFNDRSSLECYWVEDFTGFERPDLATPAEQNPQEDGEAPLPASRGGRTMTMSGEIKAGSYTKLIEMSANLEDSLIDLLEWPMVIRTAVGSPFFTQPDVAISCRATDWSIDKKMAIADRSGVFRRAFTVALRASKPRYVATLVKSVVMIPSGLTFAAGGGGLTFPAAPPALTFDAGGLGLTFPSSGGGLTFPAGATGLTFPLLNAGATVFNAGNWSALPVIRATGLIGGFTLANDNGQALRIKGVVAVGHWLEINVANGTVQDDGGNNMFDEWDSSSDWLQLEGKRGSQSGNNNLTLVADSFDTGAQISLSYSDSSM